MKVKITDPILDYEGKPVTEKQQDGTEKEITFRGVFTFALNNPSDDEKKFTTEQTEKSYEISRKLFDGKEVELTTTQAAYIVTRVGKIYVNPLIVGRVKDLLGDKKITK